MKKTILLLAICVNTIIFAQTENSKQNSNDIVINPISLILGAVNAEYERIISENSGIGVITSFVIDDYIVEDANGFSITPYYNYYFGKKRANGFYLGGYLSLNSGNSEQGYIDNNGYYQYTTTKETSFGFGFKFGGKWALKNNIIIEAGTGIGRNFGGERKINTTGMLGIGKRF